MIPLRDANPTRRPPVVTLALIGLCLVVFVGELVVLAGGGEPALDAFFRSHGVVPAELTGAWGRGQPLSEPSFDVVTSQFIHAGWLHLGGNMLYLWIFGNNVEDRIGRLPFLGFYLLGGIAAAVAQTAIDPDSGVPLVGASGSIAAALGAYLVLYPRARILSLVFLGFFYQVMQVPAVLVLGLWIGLQLAVGIASLGGTSAEGGIAFFAHIGGFVAGLAAGLLIRAARRSPRPAGMG